MRYFSHGKWFFLWETVGLYNVTHWCRRQLPESVRLHLILLILVMHLLFWICKVTVVHWCRCQLLEIHLILVPHLLFLVSKVTCRWNLDHNFVHLWLLLLLLGRIVWRSGSDSSSRGRRSSRHVRGWVGIHHGAKPQRNSWTDQSANHNQCKTQPCLCHLPATQRSTSCWACQWF